MGKKGEYGFIKLAKKSLAVLTTSLTALISNQSKALPSSVNFDGTKDLNYESFQTKYLNPKLILKLNLKDPTKSPVILHASHSSHASHASHASYSPPPGHYSHSSHSSHISSSPSYTPSSTSDYTPNNSQVIPVQTNSITNNTTSLSTDTITYYVLGSRILYKGCQGTDVKELQNLLIKLGYNISATGYFDQTTEIIIQDYQKNNQLTVDGKVGSNTLNSLQSK